MKDNCLFCNIVNHKEDALVLYEDDIVMVMMDAFPNCDGHALVIPKKHYDTIYDMDDETFAHINMVAKKYGKMIMEKLNKKALTFLINYGDAQVIKHFHLHLQPDMTSKAKMDRKEVYSILMR
ncbi:MAG: HIT domain-containing protein [Bacilli bacterium]|nr:HIT domain-containing protein [Bacilli bacterium]